MNCVRFLMGLTLLFILLLLNANVRRVSGLGVTWGRHSSQIVLPSVVVDLVLSNGLKKVKFFCNTPSVNSAFANSNVSIIITCPNAEQNQIDELEKVRAWVKENVTEAYRNGINITNVCIGHEPYLKANATSFMPDENGKVDYVALILRNLKLMSIVLQEEGKKHGFNVKASIPVSTEVLKPDIKIPSEGDFLEEMKENMTQILHILNATGAPFMINLYPYYHIRERGYPFDFAFFDEEDYKKNFTIEDGEHVYENVFDATVDMFVSAFKKNGFPDTELIIQVGWPTDGDIDADLDTYIMFYTGLLNKLSRNEGTPLYKKPLDIYINNLVDEDRNSERPRGYSSRHYGAYYFDGIPKIMDFNPFMTSNTYLERIAGITQMPRRWCVVNDKPFTDPLTYEKLFNETCEKVDCSCLVYGGSCNGILDRKGNLSYAFNMYFQSRNQDVLGEACDFDGYGLVVDEDPSVDVCEFPLQILSTMPAGGTKEMDATLATDYNAQVPSKIVSVEIIIFVSLLSLFFQLLYFR